MNSAEYNLYFLLLFNAESTIHGGSFSLIFYIAFIVYTLFQFSNYIHTVLIAFR